MRLLFLRKICVSLMVSRKNNPPPEALAQTLRRKIRGTNLLGGAPLVCRDPKALDKHLASNYY